MEEQVTAAATARRRGGVAREGAGRARPRARRAAAGPARRNGPPPRLVALATALFPGHGGGGETLPENALREACALCRSRPHDSGKDETEGVRKLGACSSRCGCDAPLAEHASRQSAASC